MANKNKRKGFLKEMQGIQPKKVVFNYGDASAAPEEVALPKPTQPIAQPVIRPIGQLVVQEVVQPVIQPTVQQTVQPTVHSKGQSKPVPQSTLEDVDADMSNYDQFIEDDPADPLPFRHRPDLTRTFRPRLIAPSELPPASLPPNLIVTSVSFPRYAQRQAVGMIEETPPENRKTRRKNKREGRIMQPAAGTLDGVGAGRVAIDEVDYVNDRDEQVASEVAAASSLSPQKPSAAEIGGSIQDWTEADRQWESLDKVKWVDFVAGDGEAMVGSVLAWKELQMNLETFTPELMLKLGRVISTGTGGPPRITLRVLAKPPAHEEYHDYPDAGEGRWNEGEGGEEEYNMSKAEIRRLAFAAAMGETDDAEESIELSEGEVDSGDFRLVATARP